MTKDIREKAEVLIKMVEEVEISTISGELDYAYQSIRATSVFQELKASLRPSREEIAYYLDQEICIMGKQPITDAQTDQLYLNYAIEELRRND